MKVVHFPNKAPNKTSKKIWNDKHNR